MVSDEPFQLMGFPQETNERLGEVVYQCFFDKSDARIAIWYLKQGAKFAVNLYLGRTTDTIKTHRQDRYDAGQSPIIVVDAFEAQLAINYLVQKHLPTEVTECPTSFRSQ